MTASVPRTPSSAAAGIGSAAAYWLSRVAGADVLCLEQWELGHDRGASEDHSRIIRLGYHAARYTALTRDSYAAWAGRRARVGRAAGAPHRDGQHGPSGHRGRGILDNYERR